MYVREHKFFVSKYKQFNHTAYIVWNNKKKLFVSEIKTLPAPSRSNSLFQIQVSIIWNCKKEKLLFKYNIARNNLGSRTLCVLSNQIKYTRTEYKQHKHTQPIASSIPINYGSTNSNLIIEWQGNLRKWHVAAICTRTFTAKEKILEINNKKERTANRKRSYRQT